MENESLYEQLKKLKIDTYEFDERSGIYEFEAGFDKKTSELKALKELYRQGRLCDE